MSTEQLKSLLIKLRARALVEKPDGWEMVMELGDVLEASIEKEKDADDATSKAIQADVTQKLRELAQVLRHWKIEASPLQEVSTPHVIKEEDEIDALFNEALTRSESNTDVAKEVNYPPDVDMSKYDNRYRPSKHSLGYRPKKDRNKKKRR